MRLRALPLLLLTGVLAAQNPALPASPQMRYVDFSADLDRTSTVVVVGTIGKFKEGKRERLADGNLGSGSANVSVSGTQYFKVPVTATVAPRAAFVGKAEKLQIGFDVQLARLPDGKEKRQALTGNRAPVEEDTLALFVVAAKAKGKGLELLHVIPFDAAVDKGADPEKTFADTMHDFYVVNQRVHDLRARLDAVDQASGVEAKQKALAALKELLDKKVELKQTANDALLTQHVGPLETRAKKRLDEAGGDRGK